MWYYAKRMLYFRLLHYRISAMIKKYIDFIMYCPYCSTNNGNQSQQKKLLHFLNFFTGVSVSLLKIRREHRTPNFMEFEHGLWLLLRKQWNTIGKFKNKRNFFVFYYFWIISSLFDSVQQNNKTKQILWNSNIVFGFYCKNNGIQ